MYTNVQEVVFIIAPNWKHPEYPSAMRWLNKSLHIQTMKHGIANSMNELQLLIQRHIKTIMLIRRIKSM